MSYTPTTIAALATAPFPSGLAVIRVSGPKARKALHALFKSRHDPIEEPRRLIFGDLVDFKSGALLGDALAVFMPGPKSYTGEDVCEFQLLGSPALIQKVMRALFEFGLNPAEPGEFSKRAFLNGKIDLVQAEAIAEYANATSDEALRVASEHLQGKFSSAIFDLGTPLRESLAELEASIDFPEEGISPADIEAVCAKVKGAGERIKKLLASYDYGHVLKQGFRVLLCGRPNVGKSSLLNLLLGRERAIVTAVSGTTRDLIEEEANIGGYHFVFCDSAGLRDTDDEVERIGVALAKEKMAWADIVIFLVDASMPGEPWQEMLGNLRSRARKVWLVVNKIDLNPHAIGQILCDSHVCEQNFYLSAKTGAGLESLTEALVYEVAHSVPDRGEASQVVTSERQRDCLKRALQAVDLMVDSIAQHLPLEITVSELRLALGALEEIVGKTYTEDILGLIFSKFCIGK